MLMAREHPALWHQNSIHTPPKAFVIAFSLFAVSHLDCAPSNGTLSDLPQKALCPRTWGFDRKPSVRCVRRDFSSISDLQWQQRLHFKLIWTTTCICSTLSWLIGVARTRVEARLRLGATKWLSGTEYRYVTSCWNHHRVASGKWHLASQGLRS